MDTSLLAKLLPEPSDSTPWPAKETGVMDLNAFVTNFYIASARKTMRPAAAKRGFSTAVRRGWFNSDGTQSDVWLVKFTSDEGARGMYLSVTSSWKEKAKPTTTFTDTAVHGTGELLPKLDDQGDTTAKAAAYTGRVFIYVRDWSPAPPSKSAVEKLMKEQYDRLTRG